MRTVHSSILPRNNRTKVSRDGKNTYLGAASVAFESFDLLLHETELYQKAECMIRSWVASEWASQAIDETSHPLPAWRSHRSTVQLAPSSVQHPEGSLLPR